MISISEIKWYSDNNPNYDRHSKQHAFFIKRVEKNWIVNKLIYPPVPRNIYDIIFLKILIDKFSINQNFRNIMLENIKKYNESV